MSETMTYLWLDVGMLSYIPRLGARVVATSEGPIALFRTADDRVFALKDKCPHRGGPLSQGIVHGGHVTCPLHGWNIVLATGEAVAPDQGCTPVISVRVEGGRIQLKLPFSEK
ncbi:MAG: nitrite reductase small subunit NirD [Rhizomicrobium sp.]